MNLWDSFTRNADAAPFETAGKQKGSVAVDFTCARMPIIEDRAGYRYFGLLKYPKAQFFASKLLAPLANLCPIEKITYRPESDKFWKTYPLRETFASLDSSYVENMAPALDCSAIGVILGSVFRDTDSQIIYDYDQTGIYFFDDSRSETAFYIKHHLQHQSKDVLQRAQQLLRQFRDEVAPSDILETTLRDLDALETGGKVNLNFFRYWDAEKCGTVDSLRETLTRRSNTIDGQITRRLAELDNTAALHAG